ncbi:hypothetical protein GCM10010428_60570 [Actinosynnema pretiosum subsp. pretiosum]
MPRASGLATLLATGTVRRPARKGATKGMVLPDSSGGGRAKTISAWAATLVERAGAPGGSTGGSHFPVDSTARWAQRG